MPEIQLLTGITGCVVQVSVDVQLTSWNFWDFYRRVARGGGFGRPPGCPPAVVNSWLTAAITAAVGPADLLECCHNEAQKISYLLSIYNVPVIFKSKTLSNVLPTAYRHCELTASLYSFTILFTGIAMGGMQCVSVVNLLTVTDLHLV